MRARLLAPAALLGTLLAAALAAARERVVVKRPRLGADVAGPPPTSRQVGKSTRFDVYSVKAMPAGPC